MTHQLIKSHVHAFCIPDSHQDGLKYQVFIADHASSQSFAVQDEASEANSGKYVKQTYLHGDACDLTGQTRQTEVHLEPAVFQGLTQQHQTQYNAAATVSLCSIPLCSIPLSIVAVLAVLAAHHMNALHC